jgi:hypothetical protein
LFSPVFTGLLTGITATGIYIYHRTYEYPNIIDTMISIVLVIVLFNSISSFMLYLRKIAYGTNIRMILHILLSVMIALLVFIFYKSHIDSLLISCYRTN